jgi:hypothetical protein
MESNIGMEYAEVTKKARRIIMEATTRSAQYPVHPPSKREVHVHQVPPP